VRARAASFRVSAMAALYHTRVDVAGYSKLADTDEERTLARLRRALTLSIRSQWPNSERARDGSARRAKMLVVAEPGCKLDHNWI
jgi:hypothetical protein